MCYHFYPFKEEEVGVSDLEAVLRNMGIELTNKELLELVNTLPVDSKYFK